MTPRRLHRTFVASFLFLAGIQQPASSIAADLPAALSRLGASPADLDVRPDRWPTPASPPEVSAVLRAPLSADPLLERWSRDLAAARGPAAIAALAEGPLDEGAAPEVDAENLPPDPEGRLDSVPGAMREPARRLAAAVWKARFLLRGALEALTPQDRDRLPEAVLPHLLNEPSPRVVPEEFERASAFDAGRAAAGSRLLAAAAEDVLPLLRAAAKGWKGRRRFPTPVGDLLIAGPEDDLYDDDELRAAIVVDLGGSNRYQGRAAVAGEGEVRLVLDLGADVVVDWDGPSAGSGRLGVGVMILPEPGGLKRVRAGDFSAGAGLFGSGLYYAAGPCELDTGRFSQGAGAFGAGSASCNGAGSRLTARSASQGFGFTRGAGVLSVRGKGASLACGLVDPDPREPLATNSLCQGAGYGPRAYSGGGAGAAFLEGDGASATTGYFGQGSGYWHSLGVFHARGKGLRLQARRYAQGAGVHAGVGLMRLDVSSSSVVNWGVGPAYGWDYGVGLARLVGDDNRVSAEWGTGHGDVNGHAFAEVRGDRNRLALPGFGTGAAKRFGASYGIAAISGKDNRLRLEGSTVPIRGPFSLAADPWGLLVGDGGLTLDPAVAPEKGDYKPPARDSALASERASLAAWLERADGMRRVDAIPLLLSLAVGFGLDETAPREAGRRLLALDDDDASAVPASVHPAHFMEMFWHRILAAAHPETRAALAPAIARAAGMRRALLVGLMRWAPADMLDGRALALAVDADWRVRREVLLSAGFLLSREEGEEPGRRRLLAEAARACSGSVEGLAGRLGVRRLPDLLAVLSQDRGNTAGERLALFEASPNFADPVTPEGFAAFGRLLAAKPACADLLRAESAATDALELRALPVLRRGLDDAEPLVVAAALAALGQNGAAEDAPALVARLDHPSGHVREAAAAGLAAMGPAAAAAVESALAAPGSRTRLFALKAAARSWDPGVVALVAKGFDDPDPVVQAMAVAALGALQGPVQPSRASLRPGLERLASSPDPSVRASALASPGMR